jgi:hypothetical protein
VQPFRPEVAARLVELVPAMTARVDAMTDRMVEVLLRTEPVYRELARYGGDELRSSTRANLRRGVDALAGRPRDGEGGSVAGARQVGRRRAAQGIPLEAVLRAFRLGGQVTWEELLAVSRDAGGGQDPLLLEVAGSVWRTNDIHCAAAAEGYREEERRLAAVDESARQHVLDGLLDGRGGDPAFVRTASELLALPLGGRLLVVVAPPDRAGSPTLADPGPALLRRGVRSVWGTRSGAQVGVVALGAKRECEVTSWLEELARGPVGVSAVVEGAAAAASAYRLAETAARTLPAGVGRVVPIDDRLPELPDDERDVLLETLAAFLASDGSPTRAADELFCHRNTVMHRLRRIESVTGRKVTDARSRLLWQLALLGAEQERPARHSA